MDVHEDATADSRRDNGVPKSTKRWIDMARSTPSGDKAETDDLTAHHYPGARLVERGLGRLGQDGKQWYGVYKIQKESTYDYLYTRMCVDIVKFTHQVVYTLQDLAGSPLIIRCAPYQASFPTRDISARHALPLNDSVRHIYRPRLPHRLGDGKKHTTGASIYEKPGSECVPRDGAVRRKTRALQIIDGGHPGRVERG